MGNVGLPEILVIAVLGLLIFGPQRLPEIARNAGRALSEFRRVTGELTEELKAGLEETGGHLTSFDQAGDEVTGTEMLPMAKLDLGPAASFADGSRSSIPKERPPGKDV